MLWLWCLLRVCCLLLMAVQLVLIHWRLQCGLVEKKKNDSHRAQIA